MQWKKLRLRISSLKRYSSISLRCKRTQVMSTFLLLPGIEAPNARSGLPKDRVVGRNSDVAHHVQDVPAPDGVACHRRDDRLGAAPHLHLW